MTAIVIISLILLIVIVLLGLYCLKLNNSLHEYKNTSQKITSLGVLQDFINIISESLTEDEKIKKINEVITEKYQIKYSTIVVYDGTEYQIKASNVEERHWDIMKNLQSEDVFRDSIETATTKYITVSNDKEKLPYLKVEFARAKSAMFFPLYIDNIYIGYWIIEGPLAHEFDNIDTTLLEVVKNNIIAALRIVENQRILGSMVRDDKYSGLKTVEYLYTDAKKVIDKYPTSAVCLFKIINLSVINEKISRKTGNQVISQVSEFIKGNLSNEYFFVRYNGSKFAIVFSGSEADGVIQFMTDLKAKVECIKIQPASDYNAKNDGKKISYVVPKLNVAITTYYKGTALEGALLKLEDYLDNANASENSINYL